MGHEEFSQHLGCRETVEWTAAMRWQGEERRCVGAVCGEGDGQMAGKRGNE